MIDIAYPTQTDIDEAACLLNMGGLVAFPTETVYGLGADAENPEAVLAIYKAKGRPITHPVIVHLPPEADISYWAKSIPEEAWKLIRHFWPGPLTIILKRADHIPDTVSGGQDTIGLRCPSHPVAQQLLRAFARQRENKNGGVAAPSANKFGRISPTVADHVRIEFEEEIIQGMMVLEGGASDIGIESTILDLSRIEEGCPATLLRPGHITVNDLAEVLGYIPRTADKNAPRASGTLKAHYAPNTPLYLLPKNHVITLNAGPCALMAIDDGLSKLNPELQLFSMPNNADEYAYTFYATLRKLDDLDFESIYVQELPQGEQWDGVRDRLNRALAAFAPQ